MVGRKWLTAIRRPENRIPSNHLMPYQITLAIAEPILTAVIRDRVQADDLSKFVPAACGEVWAFVRSAGLPRPGRHTALYLEKGLVEVGAEVSKPFVGNDRILCSQLPGGRVATTTHFGPYSRLGGAHAEIRRWGAEHGHRRSGVCWEIYGHWEESWNTDPAMIRTDVFHLLDDESG
jgi:effector-binding domain-containing protein